QDVILPVGVFLELLHSPINRAVPLLITQENAAKPATQFLRYVEQRHVFAGPGWALNLKIVSVVLVQIQKRAQDQSVHRHPHWPTPIRIASEHACVRLGRKVIDSVFLSTHVEHKRMLEMGSGY